MSDLTGKPLLLQLNFPFCARFCSHCAHPGSRYDAGVVKAHAQAMVEEIKAVAAEEAEGRAVTAVSLEGWPGLTAADDLQELLRTVRRSFTLAEDVQIGAETVPGDYSQAFMRKLRDNGVDLWTVNLLTADYEEHRLLERPYRFDALTMVDTAIRTFEMRDLSFRLLYGIPGQSPLSWERTLDKALAYEPGHLTLEPLQLIPGTRLHEKCRAGEVAACPVEEKVSLCEQAKAKLEKLGYRQYTIYDFALPGHENRFRQELLAGTDRLGFGYQASSCVDGLCYTNGHGLAEYVAHSTELEVIADRVSRLSGEGQALRLAVGRLERLEAVEGTALGGHLAPLLESGALENTGEGCRLTPLGITSGALSRLR